LINVSNIALSDEIGKSPFQKEVHSLVEIRKTKKAGPFDPAFSLLKLNIDLVFKHPSDL
jgi:hypothetical protein